MKIAVVGGGSTYTPELVSGLTRLDVAEFVLQDVDAERLDVVGGMAARMLERAGLPRRARGHRRPRPGGRRRGLRARPDPRRRPGGAASRRDRAARVRLHRPGDDRARADSRRRCARSRSCSRSPNACERSLRPARGSSTSRIPSGSSRVRLLDAGQRAVGLCNVAIGFQRRIRRWLGVEPAGWSSTRSVSTT